MDVLRNEFAQKKQKKIVAAFMHLRAIKHPQAPIIRHIVTRDLRQMLLPTLIKIIEKEYIQIKITEMDDDEIDNERTQICDDTNTQYTQYFVINSYLNEHQSHLEKLLCSFRSINPFAAQRMLQHQPILKVTNFFFFYRYYEQKPTKIIKLRRL